MQQTHKPDTQFPDLTKAIQHHSADRTVAYKIVDNEPVYLGYFLPENFCKGKRYPLFVFIHGGGWRSHKIFPDQPYWQGDYLGFLARYYADRGFVCVSIDYRLIRDIEQTQSCEIMHCYDDCCDAMEYILCNADEYGIDRERMYILGESAGGHLAAALTTFLHSRVFAFNKVFLVNPVTYIAGKYYKLLPVNSTHPKLQGQTIDECARLLSPLYHIHAGMSETVLIHGTADKTVDSTHSIQYYRKMLQMHLKCQLHLISDTDHAFMLAEYTKQGLGACSSGIRIINELLGVQ